MAAGAGTRAGKRGAMSVVCLLTRPHRRLGDAIARLRKVDPRATTFCLGPFSLACHLHFFTLLASSKASQ
jgi:hypothetical protein